MSTHRLLNIFGLVALVIVVGLLPVSSARATGAVESKMSATTGQGEGHVVISPTSQDQGTFAAEITVSIHNAQPNTTFSIQRAPDLMPDGICTGSYIPFGVTLSTSNDGAGAKSDVLSGASCDSYAGGSRQKSAGRDRAVQEKPPGV